MESLESIPEWVKETAVNLTGGIRVKSNSVIGSRDNSVSDDNQKPPLELMVLNTFSLTSDSAQTPKSWKRPSLYTRVCHSQTFQHALNKAKELSLPFIYCSASTEDFESVKFVNLVSHVLLCKMYDIILEK
ncbi:hypothetical protein C9374_003558 [Naegleria lovaniensis]|uniref:Uncharacterized protein n=1 Tax=Naegleria lovaniensis TaxID=51637 RepID=A0AA88H040_NAELO|nr:uncharacterized protein C9374_003558 [Naegleria lovaniensis]KAG2393794.1 hypothetical protein C9374_003558 [Naegleria lovaniensis]